MEITQVVNGCFVTSSSSRKQPPTQEDYQQVYFTQGSKKLPFVQNRQPGGGIWVYDFSN